MPEKGEILKLIYFFKQTNWKTKIILKWKENVQRSYTSFALSESMEHGINLL